MRQGDPHGFLAAHQREADKQAERWVNREIIRALGAQPLTRAQALERWPAQQHAGGRRR
jgi:hypothetical protein